MNRTFKTLGLSVIAVLAFAAFCAASASASQPIFIPEGFEYPVPFEGGGGAGVLETVEGTTVYCETNSNTGGEIVDSTITQGSTVTFEGCTALGIFNCTSAGQSSGTIVTNEVEGELVYTGEYPDEASVLLRPEDPEDNGVFAEFPCFLLSVTVEGSVLGDIAPTNEFTTEHTLWFSQTEGVQESGTEFWDPDACFEPVSAFLESEGSGFGGWSNQQSGIEGSVTLTTEEPVRVNSSEC